MTTHALIATAHFHGEILEERFLTGRSVQIGGAPPLALPLPDGAKWIALVDWVSAATVRVTDPLGRQYSLSSDEALEIEFGDLRLDLELIPQFSLRRTEAFSWRLSMGWFVTVLLFTILTSWYELIQERRCELFAVTPNLAVRLGCVDREAGGGAGDFAAEYLARLLKKDYAGDEDGFLTREERPDVGKDQKSIYIPAGNEGPITDLGGSKDVASEVVRAPRSEALPEPEKTTAGKKAKPELTAPEDVGTIIEVDDSDGLADDKEGEGIDEQNEETEQVETPTEEKEGWGLQDWYDEQDAQRDKVEIDYTIDVAERRLRIDPDDPTALSLLSYYQYLNEDYTGAESTYERYISILPDDAAGYNNKALIYKRRKEYKKEENLYRVALSLEPMDVTALNNLGVNLAHQGRYKEALAVMRQLEILDPGDAYADLHRAKIYAEMGKDKEALAFLRQSLVGMAKLDTLHHIEFRQDIRLDPSFDKLRETRKFREILLEFYGDDTPLQE